MDITYSEKLLAYMKRKGRHHIVVETSEAKSCGGSMAFLMARLADDTEASKVAYNALKTYHTNVGSVYIMVRGLQIEDAVAFDLTNFLGIRDITIKGIYVQRM